MPAVEKTGVIDAGHLTRTYQAGVAGMKRGTAVMQGADPQHVIPATANAQCLGLLEEDVINVGDDCAVRVSGEAVFIAGAVLNAPAYLVSNATGQLIPSAAIGDNVIARAVSSIAAIGDYGTAFITPFIR
ncbi:hypothetical protein FTO74_14385 [Granulicella sp. WH15]|uniref:hypothetical protein n=1 Tax=Granulicella sp. WH15 TaxID=2602070 RepID=UPI00136706C9|nr:hypothetical protein [Granulicella sp. WH15]QHN04420.1 hypothetical protein FTO74_14385 [Granulicella sp. WH15]